MRGDEEAEQDYDARTCNMSEWVRQMSAAPGASDVTFEIRIQKVFVRTESGSKIYHFGPHSSF